MAHTDSAGRRQSKGLGISYEPYHHSYEEDRARSALEVGQTLLTLCFTQMLTRAVMPHRARLGAVPGEGVSDDTEIPLIGFAYPIVPDGPTGSDRHLIDQSNLGSAAPLKDFAEFSAATLMNLFRRAENGMLHPVQSAGQTPRLRGGPKSLTKPQFVRQVVERGYAPHGLELPPQEELTVADVADFTVHVASGMADLVTGGLVPPVKFGLRIEELRPDVFLQPETPNGT